MLSLLRRLKLAALLIAIVTTGGTIGYRFAGLSWMDALYQTVVTITTVGYADLAEPLNVRGFTVAMIAIGTITLAVLISVITGSVVEIQMHEIIGRRKMETQLRKLENHLILCGLGRFGRAIAAQLKEKGVDFIALETAPHKTEWGREHGYFVLEEDATEEESLIHAGIERSSGILTALGSDADNVYVALTAKQMNRDLKVVSVALDERAEAKLRAAGADEVVSPYLLGGTWMAQIMTSPAVADFMRVATGVNPLDFYMEEQRLAESSSLCGQLLRETPIRSELGVIVVAVRRPDESLVTNPASDLRLGAGDVLVSLGQRAHLKTLHELAAGGT